MADAQPKMPTDFPQQLRQALNNWHTQQAGEIFSALLLAQAAAEKAPQQSAPLLRNQILHEGLLQLEQLDAAAAELLRWRFLDGNTARQVAHRLNYTENIVYQRQRAAIETLAQLLWTRELELREARAQRITARFPSRTYTRLFGIAAQQATLRSKLLSPNAPWLIALEGMGGIGKTTLADALARELAHELHFHEIAWVSARQRLFQLSGSLATASRPPSLTLAEVLDELIEQLDLSGLQRQPQAPKLQGLKTFLKEHPCLLIIDNLETVADYRGLALQLRELLSPSKCLLTTRYSLRGEAGIYIHPLTGLPLEDTLALVRYEAELQGLHDLVAATDAELTAIHQATGGNPLAVKLVIGQTHTFPLGAVLQQLEQMAGQPTENLLTFMHHAAWEALPTNCCQVAQALTLVPASGGELEQLAAAAALSAGETADCLARLAQYSLIIVRGDLQTRRYALHPLTRHFILQQSASALAALD